MIIQFLEDIFLKLVGVGLAYTGIIATIKFIKFLYTKLLHTIYTFELIKKYFKI